MKHQSILLAALAGVMFAAAGALPASAQNATYKCTCDGTKPELTGGTPSRYPACGDGYIGGSGGATHSPVQDYLLPSYLPGGEVGQLRGGTSPVFSPKSGWRCERQ